MALLDNFPTPGANMKSPLKAIVSAWLLAGTLDITAAIVNFLFTYSAKLTVLFQFIASGVFGRSAFTGGLPMAILGLVFHYIIALIWTVIFFFVYPRTNLLSKNRFVTGLFYGILVWIVMNFVVLPLSGVPHLPFRPVQTILGIVYVMFCIGMPISMIAGKYYSLVRSGEAPAGI